MVHDPLHTWLLGGPPDDSTLLLTALQEVFATQPILAHCHTSLLLPTEWGTPALVLVWGWQDFDNNSQAQAHTQLRSHLQAAGVDYQVIYPHGADGNTSHLHNALRAVHSALKQCKQAPPAPDTASRWLTGCEKCSDPVCEHRLFTGLLERG